MRDENKTMTWEELNAYVDRELGFDACARVASAIARDPILAARVASLTSLRAATKHSGGPVEPPVFRLPPRLRAASWRPVAMAASLALAFAAGGTAFWLAAGTMQPHTTDVADVARQFLSRPVPPANDQALMVRSENVSASLPDLSAAGLRLVYLSTSFPARPHILLAGYVGTHGCRLVLRLESRHDPAVPTSARADAADISVRAWTFDGSDYEMLSLGMDQRRLDRFAEIVERLVAQGHDATEDQKIALRDAGQSGAGCAA